MNARIILPFVFIGLVLTSACKKDDNDDDDNNNPFEVTINSYPQFSGMIDGAEISYNSTNGYGLGFGADQDIDTNDLTTASYDAYLTPSENDTTPLFQVSLGTLSFQNGTLTNNQFANLFQVGDYPYSIDALNGVEIYWRDQNDTLWSTSFGTANQVGNVFTLTDKQVEPDLQGTGYYAVKAKMTFNCTLYDNSGNSKALTDGIFVAYFVKF